MKRRESLGQRGRRQGRRLHLERLEDRRVLATNVWQAPASGNWSDGSNWSDGVPTPDDDVVIDVTGSAYTVTLDSSPTVASLTLNSAVATFSGDSRDLTVNGDIDVTAGTLDLRSVDIMGSGTLTNNGTFLADGIVTVDHAVVQQGSLQLENATLDVSGGMTNAAGGTVDIVNGVSFSRFAGSLTNLGTINVDDTFVLDVPGATFDNHGTFDISSSGGAVTFTGVDVTQTSGSINNDGTLTFNPNSSFTFDGGSITGANAPVFNSATALTLNTPAAATFEIDGAVTFSGDISSSQTLLVNGDLTSASSVTNDGNIILGSSRSFIVTNGTLTNSASGQITAGNGFNAITADFVNHGTVSINDLFVFNKSNASYTNTGTIEVADGVLAAFNSGTSGSLDNQGLLDVGSGASMTFTGVDVTHSGGTVQNDGTFSFHPNASFVFDGGSLTGNASVFNSASALTLNVPTAATFEIDGNVDFSGDVSTNQTLEITGNLTSATSFTNDGNIILDDTATVTVTSGSLTNSASGQITGDNGLSVIFADLVNDGTITASDDLVLGKNNAFHTNNGTIDIGAGADLTLGAGTNSTFTQAAGTLNIDGTLMFLFDTFNFNGGAVTGANPVIALESSATLNLNTTAPVAFEIDGALNFSGNIGESQSLLFTTGTRIDSLNAASGFTNDGQIELVSGGSISVTNGTLVNTSTGELTVSGGLTFLGADLVNDGTIQIDDDLSFSKTNGLYINNSTIDIASGADVTFGSQTTFEQASGSLHVDGTFTQSFGTFNFDGGGISGANHLVLGNGNLNVSSANAATFEIDQIIFFTGDISPSQTLLVDAELVADSPTTTNRGTIHVRRPAGGGFTNLFARGGTFINAGMLEIEGSAGVQVPGPALTNTATGTIHVHGTNGVRVFNAQLVNEGTVLIESDTTIGVAGFTNTNSGTLTLVNAANVTDLGNDFINEATGQVGGTGTFTLGAGELFTNQGLLAPGASPGAITVAGDYLQSAGGRLETELSGVLPVTEYDQFTVTGTATLDGTLALSTIGGYAPSAGDAFDLVSYGSSVGQFATLEGVIFDNTLAFDVQQNPTLLTATATIDPSDLVVTNITVPATADTGENITFSYTISNISNPTSADWFDSIYYSADDQFSALEDLLLERRPHVGGLATGATYTENVTATLPAARLGPGYLIVIPDSSNDVPEFNPNNQATSSPFQVQVAALNFDTPVSNSLAAGQSRFYVLNVPAGEDVRIDLQADTAAAAELLVRYGEVPTRSEYDQRAFSYFQTDQGITLSAPQAGQYYVQLFGAASANYTITAEQIGFGIDEITPASGSNAGEVTIRIDGSAFRPGNIVKLVNGIERQATSVQYLDANTLSATFDLNGMTPEFVDVVVEDVTTSETIVLTDGFEITSGNPGRLETSLTIPAAVRAGRTGVVTLDYSNPGETNLPAPILVLRATNAELRLDEQDDSQFSSAVRLLATNPDGQPGVLPPGFIGQISLLLRPTTFSDDYAVSLNETDPNVTVDWSVIQQELRPAVIPQDAWDSVVFPNFVSIVGGTTADLQMALAANADHLASIGVRTQDVTRLLAFAAQQADNFGEISDRWRLGALGRGFDDPTEYSATTDAQGDAILRIVGTTRFFRLLADGSFAAPDGGFSTLTQDAGAFRLVEKNGLAVQFKPDGTLDYYEDNNGNRITATYVDGKLDALTDSFNNVISYSYHPNGRLAEIVDDSGQSVTFTYDASGEHLLSETDPLETTTYTYVSSNSAQEHAIATVTSSDNVVSEYMYDSRGRLVQSQLAGGAERVTLSYSGGTVTATDLGGGSLKVFLDELGQQVRSIDQDNNVNQLTPNGDHLVESVVGVLGDRTSIRYDEAGNVVETQDVLGNRTLINYDPTINVPTSFVDALGFRFQLEYDSQGNEVSRTFPGGSQETFEYDSRGNVVRETEAQGESTVYVYDAKNRLIRKEFDDGVVHEFLYDARDNVVEERTENGITLFEYNSADQVTRAVYPNGLEVLFTYDGFGRRTSVQDPSGAGVFTSYDLLGRIVEQTDETGALIERYTYDALSRVTRTERGNGTVVEYAYNAAGELVQNRHLGPDQLHLEQQDYLVNDVGQIMEMTTTDRVGTPLFINFQPSGAVVPNGYVPDFGDLFGDRGNGFSYGWVSVNGNAVDRDSANAPDQRHDTLTAFGNNVFEVEVPNGLYSVHVVAGDPTQNGAHQIDVEGQRLIDGVTDTQVVFLETTALVDVSDGRLTLSVPAGAEQTNVNFLDLVQVEAGTTRYGYDALGRLNFEEMPDGETIALTFDAVGDLATRTITTPARDGGSSTTSVIGKNSKGLIESLTTGDDVEAIFRDGNGRPTAVARTRQLDGNAILVNQELRYERGRLVKVVETLSQGTSTLHPITTCYKYNSKGVVIEAQDTATGTTTVARDPINNRPALVNLNGKKCFVVENANGSPSSQYCKNAPGSSLYFTYNAFSHPTKATGVNGQIRNSMAVNADGRIKTSSVTIYSPYTSPCSGNGCTSFTTNWNGYADYQRSNRDCKGKCPSLYYQSRHGISYGKDLRNQLYNRSCVGGYDRCRGTSQTVCRPNRCKSGSTCVNAGLSGCGRNTGCSQYVAKQDRCPNLCKQQCVGSTVCKKSPCVPAASVSSKNVCRGGSCKSRGTIRQRSVRSTCKAGTFCRYKPQRSSLGQLPPDTFQATKPVTTSKAADEEANPGYDEAVARETAAAIAAAFLKHMGNGLGAADDALNWCFGMRRESMPLGFLGSADNSSSGGGPPSSRVVACAESPRNSATGQTPAAVDPNDIIGPAGFGPQRFLTKDRTFAYTIRFENLAAATAAAQEVFVTQQLDSDLDYSTFEFTGFGLGDEAFDIPDGNTFYQTIIDQRELNGLLVEVTADFDTLSGLLNWTFRALDPLTGDLTSDPFAGFLPPNVTAPEGEGFVGYKIRPKDTLVTGDVIDAQASIVFDLNDPIVTPAIANTIDDGGPTSSVDPLPANVGSPNFTVSWSGADDLGGSGIGLYDIYVSTDGVNFIPFVLGTPDESMVFSGQFGITYSFYSVATDNLGFREPTPVGAQASTTPLPDGDINDDGVYNCQDIDAIVAAIANGSADLTVDITHDGQVNIADRDAWLAEAGAANLPSGASYLLGDANLDGTVNGADFLVWNDHKFTSVASWCDGDFTADGAVDGADFVLWNINKFQSADRAVDRNQVAFDFTPATLARWSGVGLAARRPQARGSSAVVRDEHEEQLVDQTTDRCFAAVSSHAPDNSRWYPAKRPLP